MFDLAESGALERIRQDSLYSASRGGRIQVPLHVRSQAQCLFFCTAAGELLAEIGGFEPAEFERLLSAVEEFERAHPLPEGYVLDI